MVNNGLNILNVSRNASHDTYSVYKANITKAEILSHSAKASDYFKAKLVGGWKFSKEELGGVRKIKKTLGVIRTDDLVDVKPDDIVKNENTGEIYIVVEVDKVESFVSKEFSARPRYTTSITLRGTY